MRAFEPYHYGLRDLFYGVSGFFGAERSLGGLTVPVSLFSLRTLWLSICFLPTYLLYRLRNLGKAMGATLA